MNKILFVPHYSESLKALLNIAEHINSKSVKPFFLLSEKISDIDHCIELLNKTNFEYIHENNIITPKKKKRILLLKLIFQPSYYKKFLHEQKIITVVCANDGDIYLMKAAKALQIKTIGFQWAHTVPRKYIDLLQEKRKLCNSKRPKYISKFKIKILSLFGYKISEFFTDGMMDFYCLMGPYYKQLFQDQGTPPKKLIVTGHPEHDRIYAFNKFHTEEKEKETKQRFLLNPDKKVIVLGREAIRYFDIIPENEDKANIREILNILKEYKSNYEIVVKAHPRDDVNYYDFLFNEFPFVKIFYSKIDYYLLLSISDLYISQISSTMYWAIGMNIPTISYDFNNVEYFGFIKERTGLLQVSSPEEMKQCVYALLNETNSCLTSKIEEAKMLYMILDGNCIKRILNVIGVH